METMMISVLCREEIASTVLEVFGVACDPWGIVVERVEVRRHVMNTGAGAKFYSARRRPTTLSQIRINQNVKLGYLSAMTIIEERFGEQRTLNLP